MKRISVGVCCYNEEGTLQECYERITKEMLKLDNYSYEIIFADNASKDNSRMILREIAAKDEHVKVIFNKTNFGVMKSSKNLMKRISGDVYVYIPSDLQEPPEMISAFIKEWEKGYDIVFGQKVKSKENKIKYLLRTSYYKIIKALSETKQYEHVTSYGATSRWVIDYILSFDDPTLNLRHVAGEWGCKVKLLPYTQECRKYGKSSYSAWSYFSFAMDSLINTSYIPLRISTLVGVIASLFSFTMGVVYLVYKLVYWDHFDVGMAPLVIGLFFLGSVQLAAIGVLGEYIGAILRKLKDSNTIIEEERINFDADV